MQLFPAVWVFWVLILPFDTGGPSQLCGACAHPARGPGQARPFRFVRPFGVIIQHRTWSSGYFAPTQGCWGSRVARQTFLWAHTPCVLLRATRWGQVPPALSQAAADFCSLPGGPPAPLVALETRERQSRRQQCWQDRAPGG